MILHFTLGCPSSRYTHTLRFVIHTFCTFTHTHHLHVYVLDYTGSAFVHTHTFRVCSLPLLHALPRCVVAVPHAFTRYAHLPFHACTHCTHTRTRYAHLRLYIVLYIFVLHTRGSRSGYLGYVCTFGYAFCRCVGLYTRWFTFTHVHYVYTSHSVADRTVHTLVGSFHGWVAFGFTVFFGSPLVHTRYVLVRAHACGWVTRYRLHVYTRCTVTHRHLHIHHISGLHTHVRFPRISFYTFGCLRFTGYDWLFISLPTIYTFFTHVGYFCHFTVGCLFCYVRLRGHTFVTVTFCGLRLRCVATVHARLLFTPRARFYTGSPRGWSHFTFIYVPRTSSHICTRCTPPHTHRYYGSRLHLPLQLGYHVTRLFTHHTPLVCWLLFVRLHTHTFHRFTTVTRSTVAFCGLHCSYHPSHLVTHG